MNPPTMGERGQKAALMHKHMGVAEQEQGRGERARPERERMRRRGGKTKEGKEGEARGHDQRGKRGGDEERRNTQAHTHGKAETDSGSGGRPTIGMQNEPGKVKACRVIMIKQQAVHHAKATSNFNQLHTTLNKQQTTSNKLKATSYLLLATSNKLHINGAIRCL
jgi:hypothetical protein